MRQLGLGAREQFCRGAIGEIEGSYGEWSAALDEEDRRAVARVEEAERQLAEAKAALGSRAQLHAWLQRTAGRHPIFKRLDARHIAYGDLAGVEGPQPERPPELDRLGDPPPMSPEARAAERARLLAERAARINNETGDDQ